MRLQRVSVITSVALAALAATASASTPAPGQVEVTRWFASQKLATRGKGLHGVAPGGTIPFCKSHPFESIVAKVQG